MKVTRTDLFKRRCDEALAQIIHAIQAHEKGDKEVAASCIRIARQYLNKAHEVNENG